MRKIRRHSNSLSFQDELQMNNNRQLKQQELLKKKGLPIVNEDKNYSDINKNYSEINKNHSEVNKQYESVPLNNKNYSNLQQVHNQIKRQIPKN